MSGIERVGVHVPRYRLARSEIAAAWGGRVRPGARAVAGWDEDALSMAVQAAEQCLGDVDRSTVDLVIVASTTLPYAEKQTAALAAEALDLRPDVETVDVGSSLRGATQALKLGLHALAAGARRVLVTCADSRPARAGSRMEAEFGDAAVAFLLGPEAPVTLRPLTTRPSTAFDYWRLADDRFVRQGDERFGSKVIYQGEVRAAVQAALRGAGLTAEDIAALALAGADYRAAVAAGADSGFPAAKVAGQAVYSGIGQCGVATAPLCLVAALEAVQAGESALLVGYGDGVDVLLVTAAAAAPFGTPLRDELAGGIAMQYGQFLKVKALVEEEPIDPYTSEIALWRDARYLVRLHAPRCNQCGAVQYPPRRVCWQCRHKDDFTEVRLARAGRLYTSTVEYLFPVPDAHLITAVVDLSDGARIYTQLVDCLPDQVAVDMPLRLVFRRVHQGKGLNHYFWKAVPVRE